MLNYSVAELRNMSFYLRYILFCICYIDEKRCDKGEYGDKNN